MVVGLEEGTVSEGDAVCYYVVGGLDVEGFFDFGVGCYEEVEEDDDVSGASVSNSVSSVV